ncbi:hypothetical protein FCV25MIE_29857 [Fagus crenata]
MVLVTWARANFFHLAVQGFGLLVLLEGPLVMSLNIPRGLTDWGGDFGITFESTRRASREEFAKLGVVDLGLATIGMKLIASSISHSWFAKFSELDFCGIVILGIPGFSSISISSTTLSGVWSDSVSGAGVGHCGPDAADVGSHG